jgi:lipid-A-disaccharide synthase
MVSSPPLIFLIAGEPSGDLLGARLMAAIREKAAGAVAFAGIGGQHMIAQGLQTLFPMSDLSVMGLAEVLPKIPRLLRRIDQTVAAVMRLRPAALVTIDAPDFCFRVARRVHPQGIRCVHYVAPTVWAWRPERAARIAPFLDHLLALLPFEPPYFEVEGLPCAFVGHPAIESGAGKGDGAAFRARHGVAPADRIVLMLPGSREGEIGRLAPIFIAALGRLRQGWSNLRPVVPLPSHLVAPVRGALAAAGLDALIVEGEAEKFDACAAAEVALAKSGTITLELALARVPTVIAYKVNRLTYEIGRRIVTSRFVGLPNLILDRPLIPELLQDACNPDSLALEVGILLDSDRARRVQIEGAADVGRRLSLPGSTPSAAAADIVLRVALGEAGARRVQRSSIAV